MRRPPRLTQSRSSAASDVYKRRAKGGAGTAQFAAAVRELLRDKLAAWADRGQVGRTVRIMVLGIPNVGKSTFINKVAHRKTARAEDRPGVTRSKQWVPAVSYTHLTLPTTYSVEISAVAAALKKKNTETT